MLKQFIPFIIITLLLSACTPMTTFLTSADGTKIAYDYVQRTNNNSVGIVLVHMLPASKESWKPLLPLLNKEGFSTIAIDYRGRGQSTGQLAQPQDYQDIALDVNAAIDFLETQGIKKAVIIGGSIGANHALLATARDEHVISAVLLSPGLDYRGVKIEEAAKRTKKPVLIIASEDDEYSAESSRTLNNILTGPHELIMYETAGHAEKMMKQEGMKERIISFIKKTFVKKNSE